HTDFLFAVLAEELGLFGVALTLGLFLALTWRTFVIARRACEAGLKFPSYLAAGFGLWLGVQAMINIGVNMGVLPTKGLTLPLMSYGGSSLVVSLIWSAIVLRVYHEATAPPLPAGRMAGHAQGARGARHSGRTDSHRMALRGRTAWQGLADVVRGTVSLRRRLVAGAAGNAPASATG